MSFKIGDSVRLIGEQKTGTIVNIITNTALVQYANGKKIKTRLVNLMPPTDEVTPEKYDEAVKDLMYEAARDYGKDNEDLDKMLSVIGAVCTSLKGKLFND